MGITHIRVLGAKVVIARLAGYIEFFEVGPPRATGTAAAATSVAGASPLSCSTSTPVATEGSSRRCEL